MELLARTGVVIGVVLVATMLPSFAVIRLRLDERGRAVTLSLLRGIHRAITVATTVWVALFVALVVRARLVLGFWPYPQAIDLSLSFPPVRYSPIDPKELGAHYEVLWRTLPFVALASIVPVGLWIGSAASSRVVGSRPWAITGLVSSTLLWLLLLVDPGSFYDWFLD